METETILLRYATHYKAIKKIGSHPICHQLQLSDLGTVKEMKAITQKCYGDIRKDGFGDISVIDYLCVISLLYLFENCPRGTLKTKTDILRYIIKNYDSFPEETNNLLRILIKRPEFYSTKMEDIEIYKEMSGFWYKLYIKSYNHEMQKK